jgi:predicted MPP superfamily phosphohydrolase
MIAVILGGNFYVFYRLWHMMPPITTGRIILFAFAVIVITSPFISILLDDHLPTSLTAMLYKIGTSWFFIFLYLLITLLLLDLVRVTSLLPVEKFMFASWTGLGVLIAFITTTMALGYARYEHKKRVALDITVEKPLGAPLKIVAISDLHLGYTIGKKEFEKWVQLINKEEPDLVLIAGDAFDGRERPIREQNLVETFKKIRAKQGVFMALGNHEYIANVEKVSSFMQEAGVILLKDSIALINNTFYLVGRDDKTNPNRMSTQQLVDSLDKSKPIILLDHQPYNLEESEQNGIDLHLSGHTHYGQVWPISWITDAIYEKAYGYLQKGNSHIYVSSGLGIWGGKFRIGTQSEYVVITLSGK